MDAFVLYVRLEKLGSDALACSEICLQLQRKERILNEKVNRLDRLLGHLEQQQEPSADVLRLPQMVQKIMHDTGAHRHRAVKVITYKAQMLRDKARAPGAALTQNHVAQMERTMEQAVKTTSRFASEMEDFEHLLDEMIAMCERHS